METKYKLDDLPTWAQRHGAIENVLTAKWASKSVEFTYKTGDLDYPLEDRRLDVRFVFVYNGTAYVHGFCHKHNEMRSYGLRPESMHIGRGETCALREVVAAKKRRAVKA